MISNDKIRITLTISKKTNNVLNNTIKELERQMKVNVTKSELVEACIFEAYREQFEKKEKKNNEC